MSQAMNPGDRVTQAEIQAELIGTLFRSIPVAIAVHVVSSTVLVFMLWDKAARDRLSVWLAVLYGLAAVRWLLMRAYQRRRPAVEAIPPWGRAAAALSWAFGLAWGAVPVLFLDPAQPLNLIIITVMLVVLNAQALMAVVSYPPAYLASALTLLSLAAVLILRAGAAGADVALLVSLNLAASLFYARNVYKTLNRSLQLRFENAALRRETEEKSALLETTLQNIQQGISLIDHEGRLRMWNRQWLNLLDLDERSPHAGQSFSAVLNAADPPLALPSTGQLEYRRADGAIIEIRQSALTDGSQIFTYTDISELKRREEILNTARQGAEQANAAKTRFLATASHDLRQPIHALGLFFANLADRVRNAETEPLIGQIEESIAAIDGMLNALLDISKLDAGVIRPHIGPVAVAELFKRLDAEYQPLARETANSLRVRSSRAIVQTDLAMLERILRNLLANALRYTSNGRVLVGARCRAGQLRIEVHDTGSGIPADQLEAIFWEFHQLGNPERDRHQGLGLGLGLAIVKRLAALLGYPITVRSRLGRGSCFTIAPPLAERSACYPSPASAAVPGRELQGRRVLVLDDDSPVLEAMSGLLGRWGCAVIKALSLVEAQNQLESQAPPELLVVDYRLRGEVSGLEAVAVLQKNLRRYVPTLIITGDTDPEHLREAEASGYPLLHKPVQPAKLRSAVRHLIRANERE
ncbi:MAG: ATP-binding protein [Candidatus Competibacter sp.]